MGLLDRIRSGTYVPDAGPALPTPGRRNTLRETAARIDDGEDVLSAVRDFLDQAGRADADELAAMIAERPREMYVVGGAAIALTFDERRSTRDIDAVFEPKRAIYDAAAEIAGERGLAEGWLNDAVKGLPRASSSKSCFPGRS